MKKSVLIIYSDIGIDNAIRKVVDLQIQGFQELGVEVRVLITNRAPLDNEIFHYPRSFISQGPGYRIIQLLENYLAKQTESSLIVRGAHSLVRKLKQQQLYSATTKLIKQLDGTHFIGIVQHNNLPLSHLIPNSKLISYQHSFDTLGHKIKALSYYPDSWKKAERFCVFGEAMGTELQEKADIPLKNIHIIDNPISAQSLSEQASQKIQSATASIPSDFFIHLARFIERKRHGFLLEAYKRSGVTTPLLLLGSGKLQEKVKNKISELGLDDQVFLLGEISNPYPLIAQAKGLLLASSSEGMPMTILEALALHTPVISTDCPTGPREVLGEHHPEALSPVEDLNAFAQLIKQLEANPYTINPQIIERFHPKRHSQRLLHILEEEKNWSDYPCS